MEYQKSILISVILLSALAFLSSCATTQQIQQVRGGQIIDMGSYSVVAPTGENWEIKKDEEKGSVEFHKFKKNLFGEVIHAIIINVFQDMLGPEAWHQSEEEIANNIRDFEEKDMIERGVKSGQAILEDVNKDIAVIDGKKLYTMSYTIKHREKPVDTKGVLYLYFPPDFKERHIFYRFLITEMYERSSSAKPDLTIIYPVINSLQITAPDMAYQTLINAVMIKAAAMGDIKTVMDLIDKGVDVNAKDKDGVTALMWAASYGRIEVVKLLIDKNANINAVSNFENTALIWATGYGYTEVVRLLIEKGADVNLKNKKGYSALSMAKTKGYNEIILLLKKAGAKE